jgi:glycosyltransferase involved in cell wall biosynthesis
MRILHLLASPVFSGPAEVVTQLAMAQRALGHDVSVAVDRRRTDLTSEEPSAPRLAALGLLDDGGLALSVKSPFTEVWRDVRRLGAMRVDVVHAHFTHDHLVAWLGRPRGARLVRSLHAPRSLRRYMPGADAWTVTSGRELERLGRRSALVLPATAPPEFTPPADRHGVRRELGLEGAPLVGMVSTFQTSRRHDVGLAAFAGLRAMRPDARLLLVGDGVEVPAVRAQAAELGLIDAVTFAGYRTGDDFVRHLQALDTVWILGLGNDWSGRAAVQARACGVRVVAVDAGALSDWADAVVPLEPGAIVGATVAISHRDIPLVSGAEAARRVLELYHR